MKVLEKMLPNQQELKFIAPGEAVRVSPNGPIMLLTRKEDIAGNQLLVRLDNGVPHHLPPYTRVTHVDGVFVEKGAKYEDG